MLIRTGDCRADRVNHGLAGRIDAVIDSGISGVEDSGVAARLGVYVDDFCRHVCSLVARCNRLAHLGTAVEMLIYPFDDF
jgi:hypothetical protein